MERKNGKVFVKIPKDGIPGCNQFDIVELVKCVCGLVDAPKDW